MTQATKAKIEIPAREADTPIVRLLDLTAGWSAFADQQGHGEADALCRLYQEAGEVWSDLPESDIEAEERAVREFVETRILPLLLQRSK